MSVQPGQQLLHYRLIDKIGEGGMGVVWKAEDTTLNRQVAIKLLPPAFSEDPERLARFEREAKLLASLNHVNIAGIYGIHRADIDSSEAGVHFLAMELIEGEDLEQRLARSALSRDDALEIALQIAHALEAAHESGVIHRDLKPANIKLTPAGQVKVLDFGLAKALAGDPSDPGASPSMSPTMTSAGTVAGMILGTAAYMSPEQAKGTLVDRRADIWSFGVVLHEMLSGRKLFESASISETLAAVIMKDLDGADLPADTPPAIRRLLERCLQRDPQSRLRDIGDARIELEKVRAGDLGTAEDAASGRRGLPLWAALVCVPLLIAVGMGLAWMFRAQAPEASPVYLALPFPERVDRLFGGDMSKDGQRIAFAARHRPAEGEESDSMDSMIYVRDLSWPEARQLPGTERAWITSFSPSGARVFFTAMDRLRPIGKVESMPVEGGAGLTVFEYNTQRSLLNGFLWTVTGEDELLVLSRERRELYRVTTSGGEPQLVSKLEPEWPDGKPHPDSETFGRAELPRADGRFAVLTGAPANGSSRSLWRVDLESGETSLVLENAADARFTDDGRIWFVRNESLFVAPFDLDRAEVTGPAQVRLSGFRSWLIDRAGDRMVYEVASELENQETMVLVDPSGKTETLVAEADFEDPRVSPDGRRLAYGVEAGVESRIWVREFDSGLARAITPEGEFADHPKWTPDGRLTYNAGRRFGQKELVVRDPTPSAVPEPLLPWKGAGPAPDISDAAFTPDGRFVIVDSSPQGGHEGGLYLYDVGDGGSARPFFATEGLEGEAAIGPDGDWVVYQANASGRVEVYLRRLIPEDPDSAPIHPVTSEGGEEPRWSADGRTIYYRKPGDQAIYAVSVRTEPKIEVSEPRLLTDLQGDEWDVMPDERVVMVRESAALEGARPDVRVILNLERQVEGR